MKKTRNKAMLFLLVFMLTSCNNINSSTSNLSDVESDFSTEESSTVKEPEFVDFTNVSLNEKVDIVSKLENYLMENNLLGIPLYDDGKYYKYSDRVVFPTLQTNTLNGNNLYQYINSYGFGIIEEGNIKTEIPSNIKNLNYYHMALDETLDNFNYMSNYNSEVLKYNKYLFSSYFSTRLSSDKLNFEWFPSLATDSNVINGQYFPLPLDENNNLIENATNKTFSNKYRIYVRTEDEVRYNLNTTNPELIKYKGRNVSVDDYLTPYKEYYNQSNKYDSHSFGIKGLKNYYDSTINGFNQEAWDNVGIKAGSDNIGDYLDFEFSFEVDVIYARSYLNDCSFSPIPIDFINEIGGINNFASFVYDKDNNIKYYPNDTTLSTGPYVIDSWVKDKEIVFSKNELINNEVKGGDNRFNIEGIHFNMESNIVNNTTNKFQLYKDGYLDECEIPKEEIINEYLTKGTQLITGNYSKNLNLNTCDKETWEYLFGENGIITQTPKDQYWNVKPIMNNKDFIKGFNLAINRLELGSKIGYTPSISPINNNCYVEEHYYSYNSTNNHKQNLLTYYGNQKIVDNYGFDYDKAIEYFKKASENLLENGLYKKGDTIEIEICWQFENQVSTTGKLIKEYVESAFNNSKVCNNDLTLKINNTYVDSFSDVYHKKMYCGQFDMCFGSITSMQNVLITLETFNSKDSQRLSWGIDPNSTNHLIEYNNKFYTYDALFNALVCGTYVNENGANETTN